MKILTSREINTADYKELPLSWYSGREYFDRFKSVVNSEITNTTSSSGDWEGFIVQKIGKTFHVIVFSQVNNWPYKGFTVYTNENPVFSFVGNMSTDEIIRILYENLD